MLSLVAAAHSTRQLCTGASDKAAIPHRVKVGEVKGSGVMGGEAEVVALDAAWLKGREARIAQKGRARDEPAPSSEGG